MAALPRWFAITFGAFLLAHLATNQEPHLDVFELFAGVASITTAFNRAGYQAEGWDSLTDTRQDILTYQGFKAVLKKIASIQPGGLLWQLSCVVV